jgi:hypothetical protein
MSEETDSRKPEAERRLAPVSLLGVALPILQGLLASGHYTTPETDVTKIQRCDNGKDWKDEGGDKVFARRHTALAVEDAISLAGGRHDGGGDYMVVDQLLKPNSVRIQHRY